MFAEIITIGDEILYGQIVNTNVQFISKELDKAGFRSIRHTSIADNEDQILTALAEAEKRASVIIMTGGLGPTKDDITKKTLANYFDSEMAISEIALAELTAFFAYRGREVTGLNKLQAMQPLKAQHISNRIGTAPGMWFEKDGKVFVSMPGVPAEMKEMFVNKVIPLLQTQFKTPFIYHKIVRVVGIPESVLAESISDWEDNLPNHIRVAYLPAYGQVKLRLTAIGPNREQLVIDVARQVETLLPLLGNAAYGEDDQELEALMGKLLLEQNLTISCAESCTGGGLSAAITAVAGSSAYFKGGIIAYNEAAKINLLGVSLETIKQFSVYSEETVAEMAQRARQIFATDVGLATTGIAGPASANDPLPPGTIFIAYSDSLHTVTKTLKLGTERELNIKMTILAVLNLVRHQLQIKPHEQTI